MLSVLLLFAYTGKAEVFLHWIWDLWQVEIAFKNGVDIGIKYAGIITVREECFLVIFVIRYNGGLYEFLPFHNLRWCRQAMDLGEDICQNFPGTIPVA
jgi:hypothetical protein